MIRRTIGCEGSYTLGEPGTVRIWFGGFDMQTARPRDLGLLALVIGLFLILLVVTVWVGAPGL